MKKKKNMHRKITLITLMGLMMGCSVVDERKEAYKGAELLQELEVPPDLLSIDATDDLSVAVAPMGTSVTLSEFNKAEEAAQQAPKAKAKPEEIKVMSDVQVGLQLDEGAVSVVHDGNNYWLVVPGPSGKWWNEVKRFWQSREVGLEKEMPTLGLMYTEWVEDKSKLPISSVFNKAFSTLRSTNLRDQYVVRFETALEGDATEIHIVHRGVQHTSVGENLRWLPRERDTELEIEMLKRLALFIGVGEEKADELLAASEEIIVRAVIEQEGDNQLRLRLAMGFAQAWREVGDQILSKKWEVEDFNRSAGAYYLRGNLLQQTDKADAFARFLRREKGEVKPFLVKLQDVDGVVLVTVEEREGSEISREETEQFLNELKEKFD